MKHFWKRLVVCSLCLATLLLASGMPLKSYATTRTPHQPQALGACDPQVPADTGISYAADSFYSYPVTPATQVGIFSYSASSWGNSSATWPYSPGIGAWMCQSGEIILLLDLPGSPSWFNLTISAPAPEGWATTRSQSGFTVDPLSGWITIDLAGLPSSLAKQYVFSAQDCYYDDEQGTIACSQWSPPIEITAASNPLCQDGYVWREAAPFDHVCVQPWERDQAAYDNSQALNRIDPNGAYGPNTCMNGYVWRQAWGGDYVCVDPAQRDQVLADNSQALNRIVAL